MEERRNKESSQLRRPNRPVKIRCPEHGVTEMAMLPPFSCPRCFLAGKFPDVLRRSTRERDYRRRQKTKHRRALAEDEWD